MASREEKRARALIHLNPVTGSGDFGNISAADAQVLGNYYNRTRTSINGNKYIFINKISDDLVPFNTEEQAETTIIKKSHGISAGTIALPLYAAYKITEKSFGAAAGFTGTVLGVGTAIGAAAFAVDKWIAPHIVSLIKMKARKKTINDILMSKGITHADESKLKSDTMDVNSNSYYISSEHGKVEAKLNLINGIYGEPSINPHTIVNKMIERLTKAAEAYEASEKTEYDKKVLSDLYFQYHEILNGTKDGVELPQKRQEQIYDLMVAYVVGLAGDAKTKRDSEDSIRSLFLNGNIQEKDGIKNIIDTIGTTGAYFALPEKINLRDLMTEADYLDNHLIIDGNGNRLRNGDVLKTQAKVLTTEYQTALPRANKTPIFGAVTAGALTLAKGAAHGIWWAGSSILNKLTGGKKGLIALRNKFKDAYKRGDVDEQAKILNGLSNKKQKFVMKALEFQNAGGFEPKPLYKASQSSSVYNKASKHLVNEYISDFGLFKAHLDNESFNESLVKDILDRADEQVKKELQQQDDRHLVANQKASASKEYAEASSKLTRAEVLKDPVEIIIYKTIKVQKRGGFLGLRKKEVEETVPVATFSFVNKRALEIALPEIAAMVKEDKDITAFNILAGVGMPISLSPYIDGKIDPDFTDKVTAIGDQFTKGNSIGQRYLYIEKGAAAADGPEDEADEDEPDVDIDESDEDELDIDFDESDEDDPEVSHVVRAHPYETFEKPGYVSIGVDVRLVEISETLSQEIDEYNVNIAGLPQKYADEIQVILTRSEGEPGIDCEPDNFERFKNSVPATSKIMKFTDENGMHEVEVRVRPHTEKEIEELFARIEAEATVGEGGNPENIDEISGLAILEEELKEYEDLNVNAPEEEAVAAVIVTDLKDKSQARLLLNANDFALYMERIAEVVESISDMEIEILPLNEMEDAGVGEFKETTGEGFKAIYGHINYFIDTLVKQGLYEDVNLDADRSNLILALEERIEEINAEMDENDDNRIAIDIFNSNPETTDTTREFYCRALLTPEGFIKYAPELFERVLEISPADVVVLTNLMPEEEKEVKLSTTHNDYLKQASDCYERIEAELEKLGLINAEVNEEREAKFQKLDELIDEIEREADFDEADAIAELVISDQEGNSRTIKFDQKTFNSGIMEVIYSISEIEDLEILLLPAKGEKDFYVALSTNDEDFYEKAEQAYSELYDEIKAGVIDGTGLYASLTPSEFQEYGDILAGKVHYHNFSNDLKITVSIEYGGVNEIEDATKTIGIEFYSAEAFDEKMPLLIERVKELYPTGAKLDIATIGENNYYSPAVSLITEDDNFIEEAKLVADRVKNRFIEITTPKSTLTEDAQTDEERNSLIKEGLVPYIESIADTKKDKIVAEMVVVDMRNGDYIADTVELSGNDLLEAEGMLEIINSIDELKLIIFPVDELREGEKNIPEFEANSGEGFIEAAEKYIETFLSKITADVAQESFNKTNRLGEVEGYVNPEDDNRTELEANESSNSEGEVEGYVDAEENPEVMANESDNALEERNGLFNELKDRVHEIMNDYRINEDEKYTSLEAEEILKFTITDINTKEVIILPITSVNTADALDVIERAEKITELIVDIEGLGKCEEINKAGLETSNENFYTEAEKTVYDIFEILEPTTPITGIDLDETESKVDEEELNEDLNDVLGRPNEDLGIVKDAPNANETLEDELKGAGVVEGFVEPEDDVRTETEANASSNSEGVVEGFVEPEEDNRTEAEANESSKLVNGQPGNENLEGEKPDDEHDEVNYEELYNNDLNDAIAEKDRIEEEKFRIEDELFESERVRQELASKVEEIYKVTDAEELKTRLAELARFTQEGSIKAEVTITGENVDNVNNLIGVAVEGMRNDNITNPITEEDAEQLTLSISIRESISSLISIMEEQSSFDHIKENIMLQTDKLQTVKDLRSVETELVNIYLKISETEKDKVRIEPLVKKVSELSDAVKKGIATDYDLTGKLQELRDAIDNVNNAKQFNLKADEQKALLTRELSGFAESKKSLEAKLKRLESELKKAENGGQKKKTALDELSDKTKLCAKICGKIREEYNAGRTVRAELRKTFLLLQREIGAKIYSSTDMHANGKSKAKANDTRILYERTSGDYSGMINEMITSDELRMRMNIAEEKEAIAEEIGLYREEGDTGIVCMDELSDADKIKNIQDYLAEIKKACTELKEVMTKYRRYTGVGIDTAEDVKDDILRLAKLFYKKNEVLTEEEKRELEIIENRIRFKDGIKQAKGSKGDIGVEDYGKGASLSKNSLGNIISLYEARANKLEEADIALPSKLRDFKKQIIKLEEEVVEQFDRSNYLITAEPGDEVLDKYNGKFTDSPMLDIIHNLTEEAIEKVAEKKVNATRMKTDDEILEDDTIVPDQTDPLK